MNKAVQRYIEAATDLTQMTKASAEKVVKQLVKQGEAAADNAGDLVEELLDRQKRNREAITSLVKAETDRVVRAMGLASTKEVERLQKQVVDLKKSLAEAEKKAAKPTAKKAAAKKKPAKKSTAKKATKKAAKKATKKSS